MATSKKFSELPAASSVGNGDLFAIAHEDALAETGYVSQKLTAAQAGQKVNGDTEYPTSLPSFPENGQNPFAALEKLNQDIIDLYPVNTASGSIANFTTSLALPLVAMSAEIVAQQAGTGTPSPSNPRAISGWDNINIYHEGDNFIDTSTLALRDVDANHNQRASYAPFLLSAGTYALHVTFSGSASQIYVQNANDYIVIANNNKDFTFTLNTATTVMVRTTYSTTSGAQSAISSIALRQRIDTHTIALGQTVYGGNVSLTEGIGVKTLKAYDFGDLEWTYINGAFRTDFPDGKISGVAGKDAFGMCEVFNFRSNTVLNATTISDWDNYDFAKTSTLSASRYYFKDTNYTDANSFKNAYTGKKIIIDLSTPITFTFTPEQIPTLSGENNIFADSGDISVSFKQGIQEYIDAKIAETQALIL